MPKSGRNGVTIQDGAARSLRRGHGGGRGGLGNASETGGRRTRTGGRGRELEPTEYEYRREENDRHCMTWMAIGLFLVLTSIDTLREDYYG